MPNIDDFTLPYNLGKAYIKFCYKRYYREYTVVGRENIPDDCPVIFAPNHLNAVMDAIAVVSIVKHTTPVVFLARSDIFSSALTRKILSFIKIMPAFRMVDGISNLQKNQDTFDKCVEILHRGNSLGIMPEGNQGEQHKLRPIMKGIFRVAFEAQKKWGQEPKVKIVPIGIDLGDLCKARKHIIINIGKPIEVSDYFSEFENDSVRAMNGIREQLRSSLSDLTLDLASKNHYDCFETIIEITNTAVLNNFGVHDTPVNRFRARQWIGKRLVEMEKDSPELITNLEKDSQVHTQLCNKLGIKAKTLDEDKNSFTSLIIDASLLCASSLVFLLGLLVNLLAFYSPVVIRKAMKLEYDGFISSIQFGIGMFTFPIFYSLQGFLILSSIDCHWGFLPLIVAGQYFLGTLAYEWYRNWKILCGRVRLLRYENRRDESLLKLKKLHQEIVELIIKY